MEPGSGSRGGWSAIRRDSKAPLPWFRQCARRVFRSSLQSLVWGSSSMQKEEQCQNDTVRFFLNFFKLFIYYYYYYYYYYYFCGDPKMGYNRCPLFTMLTKQNSSMFCIVSFVKNRKRKWSYYLGRHAPFEEKWSIFRGDRPTQSHWSTFSGDLPTHTQSGLFSWATGPHTHTGLLSRATCPHILKVVYFQGRPALLIGFTWDPIWRSNKNKNRCVARSTWNPI